MDVAQPPAGKLSGEEVEQFIGLLARYASYDLDQWDNWRVETDFGPVFIEIMRELPDGHPEGAFRTVWPRPTSTA